MSETPGAVDHLMWVTRQLRRWCPWTRELTHAQLAEYLIEEAHETVEAIEALPAVDAAPEVQRTGYDTLRKEFGDVLFQVVLHSAVAEELSGTEASGFTLDTVAEAITEKMIRRNPHVFTPEGELLDASELGAVTIDDVEKNWERIKKSERADHPEGREGDRAVTSVFDLPAALPALAAAAKAVDRAGRQPVNPLPAPHVGPLSVDLTDEEQLGEDLFALVQAARARGLDPERALRAHLRGRRESSF
ncbi:MazG nucleotide pyrophosphohydrolase domain-containing protein [Citricoccus muralis]|uniref:MazG nucleotide pyrophosphohydrolase domain-containing protein n=1 Tax=Citricoccus muralis TaxID=169134 RepID=A0ABY8H8J6_9MICC|nr:MazG nucleotide pyrophosphohydrolase domain-containing protein [Citricoccus muralis]WFP17356.1 MazG nucleotide pyrophosphohydrolase domain-containing protein [Citricoccus muralis]